MAEDAHQHDDPGRIAAAGVRIAVLHCDGAHGAERHILCDGVLVAEEPLSRRVLGPEEQSVAGAARRGARVLQ